MPAIALRFLGLLVAASCLLAVAGCDDGGTTPVPMEDAGPQPVSRDDFDGDTIDDSDESRAAGTDTDGDGQPDYLDLDSDNDGVPDAEEAGDADPSTDPVDSDRDEIPDFRDPDSDNNGIEDFQDGDGDFDGDGVIDRLDEDDDNDGLDDVEELVAGSFTPLDFDGDGSPDFRDRDSDNDNIADGQDGTIDSDMDGIPNRFDDDSDGDTISDLAEAGDANLETRPVDTDGDGSPDFLDLDSDADTLPDFLEVENGSSPIDGDTDGDGVGERTEIDDFIEAVAGTDATDPDDNPRSRGDFVFIVPFGETPSPRRDTLEFRTNVQFADLFFLTDISGSMGPVIDGVGAVSSEVATTLTCEDFGEACFGDGDCSQGVCSEEGRCIANPEDTGCIASLWTGVGGFAGSCAGCRPQVIARLSGSVEDTVMGLAGIDLVGGDENHFEALGCMLDPSLCLEQEPRGMQEIPNCVESDDPVHASAPMGLRTCAGFRPESVKMIVMFTDEDEECTGAGSGTCTTDSDCANGVCRDDGTGGGLQCHRCDPIQTTQWAGSLLRERRVFFAGVNTQSSPMLQAAINEEYRQIAFASESFIRGDPSRLATYEADRGLLDMNDPGEIGRLRDTLVEVVREVTTGIPFLVAADFIDLRDDDGDSSQFVDHLEVNVSGEGECTFVESTADLNGDDFDDAYPSILPGTSVCWDLVARTNTRVRPIEVPQVFRGRVIVSGDQSSLASALVYFVVPPEIPRPPIE
jgi:hypothetical protein